MIKKILATGFMAALCSACGEHEKSEKEHVHGPECSHGKVEKIAEHVHGPECSHAKEEKKEHVHGPECAHGQVEESHEGHDHSASEHVQHEGEHKHETAVPEAENAHDHSIGAAKEIGEITVQGIKCDVLRSCVASFYLKPDKALADDTQVRATIINDAGDESLKSKATQKEGVFSINVEEAPAMDKGAKLLIEVESAGKKETGTIVIK